MEILNSEQFRAKLASSQLPIVVDFFAEWCGPCKMLSPVIESLVPDFAGKLEIVKVDVDDATDIAQEFGISSIPVIAFIKNGKEVERSIGFQSRDSLAAKFKAFAGA